MQAGVESFFNGNTRLMCCLFVCSIIPRITMRISNMIFSKQFSNIDFVTDVWYLFQLSSKYYTNMQAGEEHFFINQAMLIRGS